jgi:NitT/TauT family transport system ATP-binding protein
MRQRIQIARTLANDPDLLLMDEPFAALDAQTRSELQDELVDIWLATKKTVLFITHDIAEAVLLADRVGIMSKGPNSRITELFEIDLPRPRSRANPKFGEWYERLDVAIRREARAGR